MKLKNKLGGGSKIDKKKCNKRNKKTRETKKAHVKALRGSKKNFVGKGYYLKPYKAGIGKKNNTFT